MAAAPTGNGSQPVGLLALMAAAMAAGWFASAVRPPPPTPCGSPGEPGRRAVQGGVLARLLGGPGRLAAGLQGHAGGPGRVHGVLRPRRIRRERPGPGAVAEERRARRRGPGRRARARRRVPPRLLLPRLPRGMGGVQVHPAQARRGGDDGARGELPVGWVAEGPGTAAVLKAAAGRPVVAPCCVLRAVDAALVDEPVVTAHLHRRLRLRIIPQRPRREEPPLRPLHRDLPQEGEAGNAAGSPGVVLPRHGRDVRAVDRVRADGPREGAAIPGAPVPG